MKVCVYAICKNESKNVDNWVRSMSEADEIYVLDTGSTDDTVNKLKQKGVHVSKKKIDPWRFDVARNESLKLVPEDTDLYICTDLDEIFETGWRQKLEDNYNSKYTRVKYLYNWSFDKKGNPATTFYLNKIHNRNYKWIHPVHEVLSSLEEEKELLIEEIVLNHYQDSNKSRSSYLPLLELSVKENPLDDRNMHYLGREYMYYDLHYKCIQTLHKHLELESATWKDERAASMRYIARSYNKLGFKEETKLWYEKAIEEASYLREGYIELAYFHYNNQNFSEAISLLDKAFKIKEKSKSYINENFAWDYTIYDLYALCNYYAGNKKIASQYNLIALKLDPDNKRLLDNQKYYEQ